MGIGWPNYLKVQVIPSVSFCYSLYRHLLSCNCIPDCGSGHRTIVCLLFTYTCPLTGDRWIPQCMDNPNKNFKSEQKKGSNCGWHGRFYAIIVLPWRLDSDVFPSNLWWSLRWVSRRTTWGALRLIHPHPVMSIGMCSRSMPINCLKYRCLSHHSFDGKGVSCGGHNSARYTLILILAQDRRDGMLFGVNK